MGNVILNVKEANAVPVKLPRNQAKKVPVKVAENQAKDIQ